MTEQSTGRPSGADDAETPLSVRGRAGAWLGRNRYAAIAVVSLVLAVFDAGLACAAFSTWPLFALDLAIPALLLGSAAVAFRLHRRTRAARQGDP